MPRTTDELRGPGACAVVPALLFAALATAGARTPDASGQDRTPDAFYVPSRQAVAEAMLDLAEVRADDIVYDLGSGDGRIVILAAQRHGARGVGIEIDADLVARAREAAREAGVADRVRFVHGDLFEAAVDEATVVTLYLSTLATRRLATRLRQELRPGARIVSQQFDMGAWAPDARVEREGATLMLWRVPARRARAAPGWRARQGSNL